jgi:hypothetical protein
MQLTSITALPLWHACCPQLLSGVLTQHLLISAALPCHQGEEAVLAYEASLTAPAEGSKEDSESGGAQAGGEEQAPAHLATEALLNMAAGSAENILGFLGYKASSCKTEWWDIFGLCPCLGAMPPHVPAAPKQAHKTYSSVVLVCCSMVSGAAIGLPVDSPLMHMLASESWGC